MFIISDADISSKASTREIFPLLVDSSSENVAVEDYRADAATEVEPPSIIEGTVPESNDRGESDPFRRDEENQEFNGMDIANLFEHFLVVGAAPEVPYTYIQ